jgi:hypothetical protein
MPAGFDGLMWFLLWGWYNMLYMYFVALSPKTPLPPIFFNTVDYLDTRNAMTIDRRLWLGWCYSSRLIEAHRADFIPLASPGNKIEGTTSLIN